MGSGVASHLVADFRIVRSCSGNTFCISITSLYLNHLPPSISITSLTLTLIPVYISTTQWHHIFNPCINHLSSAFPQVGAAFPIWGLLLASVEDIFYYTDVQLLRDASVTVAIRFILLGICCLIGYVLQYYCIAQVGQRISTALRSDMFESLMRRDIAFFDDENNAVGNLTTQLADDARTVHKATGETFSNQLQACFTLLVGLIIGFTASWKITLVVLATFPINIAAGAMRMAERSGQHLETDDDKLLEDENKKLKAKSLKNKNSKANGSATELVPLGIETPAPANVVKGGEGGLISSAFINMRTVSAFSIQYEVSEQYGKMTEGNSARRQGACFYSGFIFGISQASMYFCYALLFWYGATLIVAGSITFVQLMTAMLALMLGALGLGQALNDLGDQTAGLQAAKRIFSAIDAGKASPIDGLSETGLKPDSRPKGRIELKNVFFSYPTRPEVEVCKDYSLVIEPGQVVALVGPSGSGKSTIMNLLLRFYDPVRGEVLLDGQNIRDLNVRWLRSQIGYVGQEPTLFSGSVSDNIARGRAAFSAPLPTLQEVMIQQNAGGCLSMFPKKETASKNEDTIADIESGYRIDGTPDDVLVASRLSYSHDFITSFTEGYKTDVGESSVMVSGGQKQRIAIARALIKQPSVLLLDEATSALDAASERIVQQSIDELQASKAQTTIIIAHRLSTIRNADKIIVIDGGRVVEEGTHEELLTLNGLYAYLWEKQSGSK